MAYFANSTEGMNFDEQCSKCRYGDRPCPIALIQNEFNYKACNNEVASAILDKLVKDNGECQMYKTFESTFFIDQNQTELF